MLKVVFVKAPKRYKKTFKIKPVSGHSKKLPIEEADEIVRTVAKNLQPNEEVKISYSLLSKESNISGNIEDATITADDAALGLVSLQNRVTEEQDNSEDALNLLNLVTSSLQTEDDDQDEDYDEAEDELSEENDDFDDEELFEDDDPWGVNSVKENEESEDDERPLEGTFQKVTENNNAAEDEIIASGSSTEMDSSPNETAESTSQQVSENDEKSKMMEKVADLGFDDIDPEIFEEENEDAFPTDTNKSKNTERSLNEESKLNQTQEVVERDFENDTSHVVGINEYLDTTALFSKTKHFSSKEFDYSQLLSALGYEEKPMTKYDRKLNEKIQYSLDKNGLSTQRAEFVNKVEKEKQRINSLLDDAYNEVNEETVAQVVERETQADIENLTQDTLEEKASYQEASNQKISNRGAEYNNLIDEKLTDYKRKLESEYQEKLDIYRKEEKADVESYNKALDEKLESDIAEVKKEATESETRERNSILAKRKKKVAADYQQFVADLFSKTHERYIVGIGKLKEDAANAAKEIDAEREADHEAALRRVQEEKDRNELKRQNDLKERELAMWEKDAAEQRRLQEKEIDLKRKRDEEENQRKLDKDRHALELEKKKFEEYRKSQMELPTMILEAIEKTTAINAENQRKVFEAQAKSMNLAPQPATQSETVRRENYDEANHLVKVNDDSDDDHDDSEASKNEESINHEIATVDNTEIENPKSKKGSKKTIVVGVTCAVALLGALVGSAKYFMNNDEQHQVAPNVEVVKKKKTASSPKASTKAAEKVKKIKKADKAKAQKPKATPKTSGSSTTTKSATTDNTINSQQTQADTQNNLKNYQAATTWQQKVDSLNAMLGQHDDRALKEINDSSPTKLSRLYEAITLKQNPTIRDIWLSMSQTEHKDLSRTAISAVAIAFYDISDWQHGWEVRNGL